MVILLSFNSERDFFHFFCCFLMYGSFYCLHSLKKPISSEFCLPETLKHWGARTVQADWKSYLNNGVPIMTQLKHLWKYRLNRYFLSTFYFHTWLRYVHNKDDIPCLLKFLWRHVLKNSFEDNFKRCRDQCGQVIKFLAFIKLIKNKSFLHLEWQSDFH